MLEKLWQPDQCSGPIRESLVITYGVEKLSQEPHRLTNLVVGGVRTMKVIKVVVVVMTMR